MDEESNYKLMLDQIAEHGRINFEQISLKDIDCIKSLIELFATESISGFCHELASGILEQSYRTKLPFYSVRFQAIAERMHLDSSPIQEFIKEIRPLILHGQTEFPESVEGKKRAYEALYGRICAIFFEDWLFDFSEHEQTLFSGPEQDSSSEPVDPFVDLPLFLSKWDDAYIREPADAEKVIRAIANDPSQRLPQVIMKKDFGISKGLKNIWGKFKTRMDSSSNLYCIKEGFGRLDSTSNNSG